MKEITNDILKEKLDFLNDEKMLRNLSGTPWAMEEFNTVRDKATESFLDIQDRYGAIKSNGKTDEENAEELEKLEKESKCVEILAMQSVVDLCKCVIKEKEKQYKDAFDKKQQQEREIKSQLALLHRKEIDARKSARPEKVYPNDPCPCGSGKKYKRCCAVVE